MTSTTQTAPATETLFGQAEEITVIPKRSFVAADFFDGWSIGDNFRQFFLGIVEETDGKPVKVNLRPLLERSLDRPIIRALGRLPKAALPGNLATFAAIAATGQSFTAYLYDEDGIPWAVGCDQDGDYRSVGADSVEDPDEWDDGRRFASCNS